MLDDAYATVLAPFILCAHPLAQEFKEGLSSGSQALMNHLNTARVGASVVLLYFLFFNFIKYWSLSRSSIAV